MRKPRIEKGGETIGTRVLALLVAIPIFQVSLFLGLFVAFGNTRAAAYTWIALPATFQVFYMAVVFAVALIGGMSGITSLLGHLFLTHPIGQRSIYITVAWWAFIAIGAAIAIWTKQ